MAGEASGIERQPVMGILALHARSNLSSMNPGGSGPMCHKKDEEVDLGNGGVRGGAALPVATVARGPPASSYTFLRRTYILPWHPRLS